MSTGPDSHLPIGFRVKHYEIRSVLGFGGFGVTYKAWDTMLERTVAVKEFMPQDLAVRFDDHISLQPRPDKIEDYQYALDRFLQEARTLAKFNHPNIVRVTDFVEANGTAYLVMDYVQGMSLSGYLRVHKGRVSEEQLRDWFLPLLRGLAEVHEAGFLHRDIKPGNIYIRDRGDPILIDFGAARQAIGEHSQSVTGIFTAGYAPVEQYTTDAKMQGAWTDLYSIGATLYRCISRVTPMDAPTRLSTVMDEDPDPLVPAVHVARGQYSEPFLELIDKLLIVRAKLRPRSTDAVIVELENCAPAMQVPPPVAATPAPPIAATPSPPAAVTPPPAPVQAGDVSEAATRLVGDELPDSGAEAATQVAGVDAGEESAEIQDDIPTQLVAGVEQEEISFNAVRTEPSDRSSSGRRATAKNADSEKPRGKGLLVTIVALVLVAAGAGGYWFILGPGAVAKAPLAKTAAATAHINSTDPAIREEQAGLSTQSRSEAITKTDLQAPVVALEAKAKEAKPKEVVPAPKAHEIAAIKPKVVAPLPKPAPPVVEKTPDVLTKEYLLSGESAVEVSSTPAAAEVALNGIVVGETPFSSKQVRTGEYELTLTHSDARTQRQQISVSADQPLSLNKTLESAVGSLAVLSKPSGATIELDGKRLDEKTPATLKNIAVGSHTVVVSKDRFRSSTRKVDVAAGKEANQQHTLEAFASSVINLSVRPKTAKIVLPDAGIEYTPGMELAVGTHRVLVTADGYHPLEVDVQLKPGLPIPSIKLRKVIPAGRFLQDVLASGGKGPEMVVIATGNFRMGCLAEEACEKDEMPAHTVSIDHHIALGRYEVTFDDYDKFVAATAADSPSDEGWGRGRHPVINVSWNDAMAYANWVSQQSGQKYRLPTEAEWEYSVRAYSTGMYYFGEDANDLCIHANVADLAAQKMQSDWEVAQCDDGVYRTAPVGSYRRNDFKLNDMHGNVWEWVQDCYYPGYNAAPTDGSARRNCGTQNRVYRGGAWSDKPAFQRATDRDKAAPDTRGNYLGFRLVREL